MVQQKKGGLEKLDMILFDLLLVNIKLFDDADLADCFKI